ncbi:MAG: hypothetical protein II739_03215, partial [Clostridia bacterium]|nr:hypothetical protein [Clostridia bacterium]
CNASNCRAGGLGGTWNTNFCGAVVNCIFTNNISRLQGGALCIREAVANPTPAVIRNCLFAFNETTNTAAGADSNGGAVLLVTRSELVMENCTIVSNNVRNTASNNYKSGGIHHRWGGTLKNCIVAFNTKCGAPEPVEGGNIWTVGDAKYYINCCGYPAVPLFTEANHCIAADPKFVDPAHGDFRLQPSSSPCVNAGLNADWMTTDEIDPVTNRRVKVLDLAGVPRLYGSNVDIGCYEVWFPLGTIISVH